ncbi:hypothetical protein VitviT2T_029964 [Vitis vinifera]|uniref:U-box domain-containing protein 4 n=2 Tax=Vitis vinifera TaxID=29760 RepID=D7T886_VITVI|eukprot:XP_010644530.1 PREDICTED: uncharacterized protein LOC100253827 isoform X2 [Vitis vinifera]
MDQPEAKQQKMSLDWEESFNLFEEAVASESTAMQIQAIIKVAQLSNYAPDNVLTRAVPILTQLLGGSSSPLVQEAAAYCLKCIAHQGDLDDRLATLIGQSGAIPITLRLLQHSHGGLQGVLVKFLWSIVTFGTHNRVIVVRNGGLEVIINMLGSCVGSTRRHLLEILSALVWLREVRRVITSPEGLQFLVEAVKFGGMASRERAAYAVGSLGVARSARTVLVDLGAMQALMELLREGDISAKLVAGNALGVISANVDCIRPLAQAGAIPLYAELLRGAEPVGKEIAEDVFCVLAIAEVNAVSIAQHLAQILRENDDIAKAAAAEILGHLSRYKHSVPFITNSGAIPVLVELLRQGSDEVKEKASGAIAQLSYNAGDRAALADAGAIPILMDLLGDDQSEELRNKAAEALISFSEDPSQRDRISEAFNITSFQDIHNRLAQLRAPDNNGEQMARPSRQMMSMEQLPWDPNIL